MAKDAYNMNSCIPNKTSHFRVFGSSQNHIEVKDKKKKKNCGKKSEDQSPILLQITLMTDSFLNHEKINQLQKLISKS